MIKYMCIYAHFYRERERLRCTYVCACVYICLRAYLYANREGGEWALNTELADKYFLFICGYQDNHFFHTGRNFSEIINPGTLLRLVFSFKTEMSTNVLWGGPDNCWEISLGMNNVFINCLKVYQRNIHT